MERGRGSAFGSFFLSSSHFGRGGGLMEKKSGLSFCAPPRVKAREGKKKKGNAVDRRNSTATAALLLLSPLLFLFPATRGELFSPFLVRRCLFIDRLPLFWRAEGESKSAERDNQRRQSPLSLSLLGEEGAVGHWLSSSSASSSSPFVREKLFVERRPTDRSCSRGHRRDSSGCLCEF